MPVVKVRKGKTEHEEFVAPEWVMTYIMEKCWMEPDEDEVYITILWSILENPRDFDQSFIPWEKPLTEEIK